MFLDNSFPDQAVVLCHGAAPDGGDGSPAAVLQRLNGVPFLGHVLGGLKRNTITDVVLLTHEDGAGIETEYGDGGPLGLRIRYVHDPEDELGTGGTLRAAQELLRPSFYLVDAHRFPVVDYESLGTIFVQTGLPILMSVWNTGGASDADCLVDTDAEGRSVVRRFHPEHRGGMQHARYGASVFRDGIIERLPPGYCALDGILQGDALRRRIGAYEVDHRYYDVCTGQGLRDLRSGVVSGAVPSYIHLL
ncbi:MAG: NDP-sugar pyrophosphorylase family protein [Myxococcota bacterium]|jgi:NDP-sugar pyrophosphorylase family protein